MIAEVADREIARHKVELAANTPAKPAPPAAPPKPAPDPFMARLFQDTGHVIGEDGALSAKTAEAQAVQEFRPSKSLMDRANDLKDKAAAPPPSPAATTEETKKEDAKLPGADSSPPAKEPPSEPGKDAKTPETPAAAPTPPTPDRKVEVATEPPLEKIVKETVEKALEGRTPPKTETATTEAPKPNAQDEEYEAGLEEEQREELELARFAAQKNPERYKDLPRQIVSYFRAADAEYDRLRQANAETADAEIKAWTEENKPQGLSYRERKTFIESRAEEKVLSKTERMIAERDERYERELHQLKVKPQIEKSVEVFRDQTRKSMALAGEDQPGVELAARAKEVGWDAAIDEDKIEGPIVRQVHQNAELLARAYLDIATGTTPFDPDNRTHASVLDFVIQDGQRFAQAGGDARVRELNGVKKTFLPRDQYVAVQAKDANKAQQEHWTFEDHEILARLAEDAARAANFHVRQKRDELEKAGYKREKTKAAPKKEATPAKPATAAAQDPPSPKSTPSSSPGAATSTGVTLPTAMDEREMNLLVPGWKR